MSLSSLAFYCTGNLWQTGGGSTVVSNILREYSQSENPKATLYVSRDVKLPVEILSGFHVVKLPTPASRLMLELFDQFVGSIILTFARHDRVICLNSIVPLLAFVDIDVYFQMRMYFYTELDGFVKKVKNILGVLSVLRARTVFVASQDHKLELCHRLRLNSHKVKVAYLGVNAEFIDAIKPATFSYKYICFVSVLRPYKNLHVLLRAYSQATKSLVDFPRLLIVGDWPNYKDIERYNRLINNTISELDLSDHVIFTGSLPHSEAISIIKGSIGLVFPTLFEGFGLPLLEAMACKVPVITSDRNSLPEIGGDCVVYANPESTSDWSCELVKLINGEYPEAYVSCAYYRSQEFTWNKTLKAIMQ